MPAASGTVKTGNGVPSLAHLGLAWSLLIIGLAMPLQGQTSPVTAPPLATSSQPNLEGLTEGTLAEGVSSREARSAAVRSIPFDQLTPEAIQRLRSVLEDASYFRRLPTQTVACDPEMYVFLVRHPEVVVSLWDVMGITNVTLERIGEYQLTGDDGAGTKCKMDLIYGSDTLHIYQSQGAYEGGLWARELRGRCVVAIHNRPTRMTDGRPGMIAWMDAFMKLENVGADLVVKTLGPLVARTADHNFVECAGFFSQISHTARTNPQGLKQVAGRLHRVAPAVREEFIETSLTVANKSSGTAKAPVQSPRGISTSSKRVGDDPNTTKQGGESSDSPPIQLMVVPNRGPTK